MSAIFAVALGLASALGGMWLARGSLMSEGFVLAAFVVWSAFGWGLLRLRRAVAGPWAGAMQAKGTGELRQAGFGDLAAHVEASVIDDPRHGPRRRAHASGFLREGSSLVPSTIRPGPWLSAGQAFLISLGLFGTFVGLSYGLHESIPYIDQSDPEHAERLRGVAGEQAGADSEALAMQVGMSNLLNGARTAFSKSVAGIGLGLSYMLLWRLAQAEYRRRLVDVARRAV